MKFVIKDVNNAPEYL